jgi:hypothetical protein
VQGIPQWLNGGQFAERVTKGESSVSPVTSENRKASAIRGRYCKIKALLRQRGCAATEIHTLKDLPELRATSVLRIHPLEVFAPRMTLGSFETPADLACV